MIEAQMRQSMQPSVLAYFRMDARWTTYLLIHQFAGATPIRIGVGRHRHFDWNGQSFSVTSVVSPRYTVDVLDTMTIRICAQTDHVYSR